MEPGPRRGAGRHPRGRLDPSRLVTRIDAAPDAAFGGRWVYELASTGPGTSVTVTEEGWVGNPLFRLMSKLGGQHGSIDGYLAALAKKFGEESRPEHVTR